MRSILLNRPTPSYPKSGIRALELFACSGGMGLGMLRAGIEIVEAVEKDSHHAEAYEANTGHPPLVIDARLYLKRLLVRHPDDRPRFDLVIADPPCTPYSHSGKKLGLKDPRDGLAVTCEIIRALRPRAWLIANVPGLDESSHAEALDATVGALGRDLGCAVDFIRTDCADYGVPQHRRRPWWFGRPEGSPPIAWPEPTHGPGLLPWVTVRQALEGAGLGEAANWGRLVRVRKVPRDRTSRVDEPARTQTTTPSGDPGVITMHAAHPGSELDAPAYTVTTKHSVGAQVLLLDRGPDVDHPAPTVTGGRRSRGDALLLHSGTGRQPSKEDEPSKTITAGRADLRSGSAVMLEWPWDRPCTTIQTDERIGLPGLPGHHDPAIPNAQHGPLEQAIVLNERALRVLQGVPTDWVLGGSTATRRRSQLGQMMPPGMAEAIGGSIVRWPGWR